MPEGKKRSMLLLAACGYAGCCLQPPCCQLTSLNRTFWGAHSARYAANVSVVLRGCTLLLTSVSQVRPCTEPPAEPQCWHSLVQE
jgi:hypothetical protein